MRVWPSRTLLSVAFFGVALSGCNSNSSSKSSEVHAASASASASADQRVVESNPRARRPAITRDEWAALAKKNPNNRYLPARIRARSQSDERGLTTGTKQLASAWLQVRAEGWAAPKQVRDAYFQGRVAALEEKLALAQSMASIPNREKPNRSTVMIQATRAKLAAIERARAETPANLAQPQAVRPRYLCYQDVNAVLSCIEEDELVRIMANNPPFNNDLLMLEFFDNLERVSNMFEENENVLFSCGTGRWGAISSGTNGPATSPGTLGAELTNIGAFTNANINALTGFDMLTIAHTCALDVLQTNIDNSRRTPSGTSGPNASPNTRGGVSECTADAIQSIEAELASCTDQSNVVANTSGPPHESGGQPPAADRVEDPEANDQPDRAENIGGDNQTNSNTASGNAADGDSDGSEKIDLDEAAKNAAQEVVTKMKAPEEPDPEDPTDPLRQPNPPDAQANTDALDLALYGLAQLASYVASKADPDPDDVPLRDIPILKFQFDCPDETQCGMNCESRRVAWKITKQRCQGQWDAAGSICGKLTGCDRSCADPRIVTPSPDSSEVCASQLSEEQVDELRRQACERQSWMMSSVSDRILPNCDFAGNWIDAGSLFNPADIACGPYGYGLDCDFVGGPEQPVPADPRFTDFLDEQFMMITGSSLTSMTAAHTQVSYFDDPKLSDLYDRNRKPDLP